MEPLYVDEQVVAVCKPSGLASHRSELCPERDNCMVRVRNHVRRKVFPVHRLDRATSGVLLFALDPGSARRLAAAFARRQVLKTYLAVVRGFIFIEEAGIVERPLPAGRHARLAEASTRFEPLARVELPNPVGRYATARYSLLRLQPLTGRRHQLRRHLVHLRHPIVGDTTHGDGRHNRFFRERFGLSRLLLHACSLELAHPEHNRPLCIEAPLPGELSQLFRTLGWPTDLPA